MISTPSLTVLFAIYICCDWKKTFLSLHSHTHGLHQEQSNPSGGCTSFFEGIP